MTSNHETTQQMVANVEAMLSKLLSQGERLDELLEKLPLGDDYNRTVALRDRVSEIMIQVSATAANIRKLSNQYPMED